MYPSTGTLVNTLAELRSLNQTPSGALFLLLFVETPEGGGGSRQKAALLFRGHWRSGMNLADV